MAQPIGEAETAVVILSYNSRKWHELFLPLIVAEASGLYTVYVVDHASPDDTASFVQTHFPSVKIIKLHENHGFAWGYSQALKQIEAKYYVLLSSDFEVTPNWFRPLHQAMESNADIVACQPKIRYYKAKEYFEYAGAAGGFRDKFGYLFCRGRVFDELEKDEGQYDDDCWISWASGGCLMVRSEAYHRVGGLDEDFFAHMEEVDLCWRLIRSGGRIRYIATSTVFHVGGSIITYGSPEKTFYNFRNSLVLLLKNEKAGKLIWLLPFRLILDGLAGVQLILKGKPKLCWAVVRAHWNFFGHFNFWRRKRSATSAITPDGMQSRDGYYPGSIVWAYYVQKKKKFSELHID